MTWFERWFGSRGPTTTPTIDDLNAAPSIETIERVLGAAFDDMSSTEVNPGLYSDADIKIPLRKIRGELGRRLALIASV